MTNEAGYLIVFIRNLHSLSIPARTDQGKMESQLRLLGEAWVFFFFFTPTFIELVSHRAFQPVDNIFYSRMRMACHVAFRIQYIAGIMETFFSS